jgi:hypothetical protein
MGVFSIICGIYKYGNFSRLLPHPLAKPQEETKFGQFLKNKSKLVFVHTLIFVGIAAFLGAYFAK